MQLKKLHLGQMLYGPESNGDIKSIVNSYVLETTNDKEKFQFRRSRASIFAKIVGEFVIALALCHNVTPTIDENSQIEYQASSPDEIAIVEWTHKVGLSLLARSTTELVLGLDGSDMILRFEILAVFPFTSERKRMGILIRDLQSQEISFYLKGADSVMIPRIKATDWVEEEVGNMAREGLRYFKGVCY
jgi:phospholipid-translocating ATPase